MTVFCFLNGNTAVCDGNGNPIQRAQVAWLRLLLESLEEKGYDPTRMEIILPTGLIARPFKTLHDEWNWHVSTAERE